MIKDNKILKWVLKGIRECTIEMVKYKMKYETF